MLCLPLFEYPRGISEPCFHVRSRRSLKHHSQGCAVYKQLKLLLAHLSRQTHGCFCLAGPRKVSWHSPIALLTGHNHPKLHPSTGWHPVPKVLVQANPADKLEPLIPKRQSLLREKFEWLSSLCRSVCYDPRFRRRQSGYTILILFLLISLVLCLIKQRNYKNNRRLFYRKYI